MRSPPMHPERTSPFSCSEVISPAEGTKSKKRSPVWAGTYFVEEVFRSYMRAGRAASMLDATFSEVTISSNSAGICPFVVRRLNDAPENDMIARSYHPSMTHEPNHPIRTRPARAQGNPSDNAKNKAVNHRLTISHPCSPNPCTSYHKASQTHICWARRSLLREDGRQILCRMR